MTEKGDETVAYIAGHLNETAKQALVGISRIIKVIGPEQAQTYMKEAIEIEKNGGMLLPSGKRRTLGGVFFRLVRDHVTPEQQALIWPHQTPEGRAQRAQLRAKLRAASPVQPAKKQDEPSTKPVQKHIETTSNTQEKKERTTTVKITIIGRPASKVSMKDGYVATVLQTTKIPALPKGLPAPAAEPTNYVVYIANKQWKNVSQAIEDPEDTLIIEGFPQVNAANNSIKVFATNVTTKNLQRAKREEQKKEQV